MFIVKPLTNTMSSVSSDEYGHSYSDFYNDYYMSDDENDTLYTETSDFPTLQDEDSMFAEHPKLKIYLNLQLFCDVRVKIEEDVFNLHRVLLSLNSLYFQKLFAGNFVEHNQTEVELQTIDVPTFNIIIRYIYEKELFSSITFENMTKLLIALDYLQINVNLDSFVKFINDHNDVQLTYVFEFYEYVLHHSSHPWLLNSMLKYFSKNLVKISHSEYFCTISFDQLKKILLFCEHKSSNEERDNITYICAKWINYDVEERSQLVIELVNVIKYRYSNGFFICNADVQIDGGNDEKSIAKKLNNLLNYSAEFIPGATLDYLNLCYQDSLNSPKNTLNVNDEMRELLETGILSDVSVTVGSKTFQLHRIVLACKSHYFHDLFTKPGNENVKEFKISELEECTFDMMMRYVYYQELELTSKENIAYMLHACEFLQMKGILFRFEQYILLNLDTLNNIFDLFSYLTQSLHIKLLSRVQGYIIEKWTTIFNQNSFLQMSADVFKEVISLPNLFVINESDITSICSKWIIHDLENRLHHLPSLLQSMCRCISVKYTVPFTCEDVRKAKNSEKFLENKIYDILSACNSINEIKPFETTNNSDEKPFFIAGEENTLRFYRINENRVFTEILSMRLTLPNVESISSACAAIIKNTVYVKFNEMYLYAHNLDTKRSISLTNDGLKNNLRNTQLLNCNEELYLAYRTEGKLFKYSTRLNRWLHLPQSNCRPVIYACSGKVLYAISNIVSNDYMYSVEYYDEQYKKWKSLPPINDTHRNYEYPIAACFINQNLFVACRSYGRTFNFKSRKWSRSIEFGTSTNFILDSDSCHVKQLDKYILFLSRKCISSLNPANKNWKIEFNCDDDGNELQCFNFVHSLN